MTIEKNIHIMKLSFSQRWYNKAIIIIFIAFTFEKCLRWKCQTNMLSYEYRLWQNCFSTFFISDDCYKPLQFSSQAFTIYFRGVFFFCGIGINRVVQHPVTKKQILHNGALMQPTSFIYNVKYFDIISVQCQYLWPNLVSLYND